MRKKEVFAPEFLQSRKVVERLVSEFDQLGEKVGRGRRNVVKRIPLNDALWNVKAFKKPHLFNRLIYGLFRKSKARRSFEYARNLMALDIGTPDPVAYIEHRCFVFLTDSFYVCKHLEVPLTFRDLIEKPNIADREDILRAFTRFTDQMHQKGVLFLDHSPGNTLIKRMDGQSYGFYLVDLNRMKFGVNLSFQARIKNFARLSCTREMVAVISDEYAIISGKPREMIGELMWHYTEANHQRRRRQKQRHKALGKYA